MSSIHSTDSTNNHTDIDQINSVNLRGVHIHPDAESLADVVIDENTNSQPTSASLLFCKKKFILPYTQLLTVIGLRPVSADHACWKTLISYLHTLFIVCAIVFGYYLQFCVDFRRNHRIGEESRNTTSHYVHPPLRAEHIRTFGDILFNFAIPAVIHFLGYIVALFVYRIHENEQLQSLSERVFILTDTPKQIFWSLWVYVAACLILLVTVTCYCIVMVRLHSYSIPWIQWNTDDIHDMIKAVLVATIFIRDLVQVIILSSFCVQCFMLKAYILCLSEKLVQHTIPPLEWMREMCEFQKLLDYFNTKVTTPVCFHMVLSLSYAMSAFYFLFTEFNLNNFPTNFLLFYIGNIVIWSIPTLVPFVMASTLTAACQEGKSVGHQIIIRPFVHNNTSADELKSILMYASTLQLNAKLFKMPIQWNYLCFTLIAFVSVILILGMCFN